ncbi:cytochrome b5-like heme/steroid binding domain-containing protein [Mycotypha africana]|uniref:cytochrome b5-like heme/steroid binding domain-containing protein n=1 Tax=Mycotypha africana TaxID=64632 RepID=UPI0023011578|nr:cytochrome b5-like heme/steroid binding domain-containing protein [Mycotypha africana]KAI8987706.1 cytochrome b5-like heme/steroid binding domain-containing protein [Mycotypha africana]
MVTLADDEDTNPPKLNLTNPQNQTTLDVPIFPARDGPQRLVAAATKQPKNRQKVRLEPGHSPLDWAKLCSSGKDLRGVTQLSRYTLDDLKKHKTEDDAWTAIHGKVYNITPYLKFHPGGVRDLMRCAGRDGTKLFMLTHSWVNVDFLLEKCLVGFLVPSSVDG